MSLALLVPAFLIGLGLLAIPIVVHLRQRERREPIRFPSLMFLSRLTHRTSERRRLTHLVLLATRALAVILLVIAFARPFLKRQANLGQRAGGGRAVVLLVDQSMSMGYRDVWPRARDSIAAVLATLGPADRVALVAFDETADLRVPLGVDLAAVRGAVDAMTPTGRSTRFAPAFRLANEVAARGRGLRSEIVVVSDLQRHAVAGLESVDRPPQTTLRVIGVAEPAPANARVVDAEVDQTAAGRVGRLAVSARVASKAATGWTTTANLIVAGRVLASQPVRLQPNAIATVRFESVSVPTAEGTAAVALAPDALAADDTLRLTLGSATGVTVLLVLPPGMPGSESLFLERALAISKAPVLNVAVRRTTSLAKADLDRASAVVIADLSTFPAGAIAALEPYLAAGGGVVAFSGRRGPERRAQGWAVASGRVVDRSVDRGARLGQLDADHPALEPFKAAITSDFGVARFYRYRELAVDSTTAVLGRFDDGRPALAERRVGAGRAIMAAFPADAIWSDLVLQPVFLPLVQRLVTHAAGLVEQKRWFAVGDAAPLPTSSGAVSVEPPVGRSFLAFPDSVNTVVLTAPGVYRVTAPERSAPLAYFAVNTPAAESELSPVDPSDLDLLFRPGADSTALAEARQLTVVEQERAQSWWVWLLAAALALLAVEAWYAGRIQRGVRVPGGAR